MRRAPRNLLVSLLATVVTMLMNLFASRIVVHHLPPEQYGAWVILFSFMAYTSLLDLGMSQSLVRLMARDRGEAGGRPTRHLAPAIRAYLVMGTLAALLVGFGGVGYSAARGLDVSWGSPLLTVDLLLAASAIIALPAAVFTSVLASHERYDIVNGLAVVQTLAVTGLTVLVFIAHGTVLNLALITAGVTVVTAGVRVALAAHYEPGLWAGLAEKVEWRSVRDLLAMSAGFFVQGAAVLMIWRLDPLVVGAGVSIAAVTTYSLAQRLATAYQDIGTVAVFTLLPSLARLDAGGAVDEVRRAVVIMTRIAVVGGLPLTILLMLEARPLLWAWVGPPYDRGAPISVLLVIAVGVAIIRNPSLVALQAIHSIRTLAWFSIGEGVANVVLSIALVFPLHEAGVAIGTLIPSVGFSVFGYIRVCMKRLQLSPAALFGPESLRGAVGCALGAAWFLFPVGHQIVLGGLIHGALFAATYCLMMIVTTPGRDLAAAGSLARSAWKLAATPGGAA